MSTKPLTIRETAGLALALGLFPVPVKARSKAPSGGKSWQARAYTPTDFDNRGNIGLDLRNLVDADLDSEVARRLAPHFLPPTTMKYGRLSKPSSHWVYMVDDPKAVTFAKYQGLPAVVDGKKSRPVLLERRTGSARQSVIPPSIHESGEAIAYVKGDGLAPSAVNGKELSAAFDRLAAGCLIASVWGEGARHELALAVPGFLLKSGASPDLVTEIMTSVVEEFDDPKEIEDRKTAIKDTIEKHAMGGAIKGASEIVRLVPESRVFMDSLCTWLQLKAPREARVAAARAKMTAADGRPTIIVGDSQYSELSDQAFAYLVAGNSDPENEGAPSLYQRGSDLARVRLVKDQATLLPRPQIQPLDRCALMGRLMHVINWGAVVGFGVKPCAPPAPIVSDIATRPVWPGIPYLRDVTETPIITRDGDIVLTLGYQPETGLWYHPGDLVIAPVPDRPTKDEIVVARDALLEIIVDFPFEDQASRCNAFALLLTPILRELIAGCVPLVAADASTRGAGKGKLIEAASILATGAPPRGLTWHEDEQETRKAITSTLLTNAGGVVGWDNVNSTVQSQTIASLLTTPVWTDRVLGVSEMAGGTGLPVRALFYVTGNNLQFSGEITRRTSHIRLVPDCERPEERTGFRHDPLIPWILSERGRLLREALLIARATFHAYREGRLPKVERAWGSYELFNTIVGGMTKLVELEGWQDNRDALAQRADLDTGPLLALFDEWHRIHGRAELTASTIARLPSASEAVPGVHSEAGLQRALGHVLQKNVDRVVDRYRLRRRTLRGRPTYRLEAAA